MCSPHISNIVFSYTFIYFTWQRYRFSRRIFNTFPEFCIVLCNVLAIVSARDLSSSDLHLRNARLKCKRVVMFMSSRKRLSRGFPCARQMTFRAPLCSNIRLKYFYYNEWKAETNVKSKKHITYIIIVMCRGAKFMYIYFEK